MATHVHDNDWDEDGVSSAVAARAGAPAFLDCIKADNRVKSLSLPAPPPSSLATDWRAETWGGGPLIVSVAVMMAGGGDNGLLLQRVGP
jgi:hypothetical protein